MGDIANDGTATAVASPRQRQELGETLQRLRLGGPFYVLLWLLAGTASGIWERTPWSFLMVALVFIVLTIMRFRIRGLPEDASEVAVRARLNAIWNLLLTNAALWGAAIAWLLIVTPNESARTVAAISSYAFATAFAHNFPMRLRSSFFAVGLLYLPTLAALIITGARLELVAVGFLYLLYVSLALRRSHLEYEQRLDLQDALREQRDLFEQQSRRDGLTALPNRRHFSDVLNTWSAQAAGDGSDLALLILDLDHFKQINDRHGHAVGDACLRAFADSLQQAFPASNELVARLGGEEFGVLLRSVPLQQTMWRAQAFCREFEEFALPLVEGEVYSSVSIGVAAFDPGRDSDGDALYRAADVALYQAKAAGRNTVRMAELG
jgi:diguanylate cyclase